jgi:hypothetical protein
MIAKRSSSRTADSAQSAAPNTTSQSSQATLSQSLGKDGNAKFRSRSFCHKTAPPRSWMSISDPAAVDPDARELWSRALSDFSIFEQTNVNDKTGAGHHKSSSEAPRAVRLMTSEELGRLPSTDLILFANSSRYAKRPVRLRKTRHDDHRLAGLAVPVVPIGVTT